VIARQCTKTGAPDGVFAFFLGTFSSGGHPIPAQQKALKEIADGTKATRRSPQMVASDEADLVRRAVPAMAIISASSCRRSIAVSIASLAVFCCRILGDDCVAPVPIQRPR
jgi:hypothetical protein